MRQRWNGNCWNWIVLAMVGIGICEGRNIEVGNFGGNWALECYLDIMVDTFEECPMQLFARTVYI
jgi:allantoicase